VYPLPLPPPHATMPSAAMTKAVKRVKVRMASSLAARCERRLKRRPPPVYGSLRPL
jgi:hypothetical protein